jgi:hypothetical protein
VARKYIAYELTAEQVVDGLPERGPILFSGSDDRDLGAAIVNVDVDSHDEIT